MTSVLCECGCGSAAPLAPRNMPRRGWVKGEPLRFVHGHNSRVQSRESREKMAARLRLRVGERARGWRGGVAHFKGRRLILVGRDHPMANGKGYCYEHRLVMAGVLGRMLTRDEHVHHIDLDHTNNLPQNLVLISESQHRRIHNLIRKGIDPVQAVKTVIGP